MKIEQAILKLIMLRAKYGSDIEIVDEENQTLSSFQLLPKENDSYYLIASSLEEDEENEHVNYHPEILTGHIEDKDITLDGVALYEAHLVDCRIHYTGGAFNIGPAKETVEFLNYFKSLGVDILELDDLATDHSLEVNKKLN